MLPEAESIPESTQEINSPPKEQPEDYEEYNIWLKWEKVSKPERVTFGVELEFFLAFQRLDAATQNPRQRYGIVTPDGQLDFNEELDFNTKLAQKREAQKLVADTLKNAGVAATYSWEEPRDFKVEAWYVENDASLVALDEKYEFVGIEISSPPLFYTEEARLLTSGITQLLTSRYGLLCNATCGLHVHVGNGCKAFHPYVLCNLFALIWAFEERLEMLHPKSRRTRANPHCKSLYSDSKLGRSVSHTPEGKRIGLEKLLKLRYQNTTTEIVDFMGNVDDRLAYNVQPLMEPLDPNTATTEFRGHEGTMNSESIVNWINVCVGLVEFADTVDPNELDNFLWSYINDNDFTVIDLLRAIGRPAEAEFYERTSQYLSRSTASRKSQTPKTTRKVRFS